MWKSPNAYAFDSSCPEYLMVRFPSAAAFISLTNSATAAVLSFRASLARLRLPMQEGESIESLREATESGIILSPRNNESQS